LGVRPHPDNLRESEERTIDRHTVSSFRCPLGSTALGAISFWGSGIYQPTANSQQPTANSQQPTANSQQPTAISHQPTAISHQPSAISHQSSAISHQPSAIGLGHWVSAVGRRVWVRWRWVG
jgi:hypothetical protein